MRNNGSKYIVVVALLISVVALSLGFAAFSNTLTINSSATYTSDEENFRVIFTQNGSTTTGGSSIVTPTKSPTTITAGNATISGTTISGLSATFAATGQSVTYNFYTVNATAFLAYLNSINIGSKTCTAADGTTQSYVNAACNDISLSVKAGSASAVTTTQSSINSHTVAAQAGTTPGYEAIQVVISYAANGATADGDFTVSFGPTTLVYGTAD